MVDEGFARYILGELFWELERFEGIGAELTRSDAVEVVSCTSYHDLQVRFHGQIYDVWLSWRGDVPPRITPVKEQAV